MIGLGMNGHGPEAINVMLDGGGVNGGIGVEIFGYAHRKVQLKEKGKKRFE